MKYAIVALLIVTAASAQTPVPDPATLPRTGPPPQTITREWINKYRDQVTAAEKHSKAHQCADKVKGAGLDLTPENIKAQCGRIFKRRVGGPADETPEPSPAPSTTEPSSEP